MRLVRRPDCYCSTLWHFTILCQQLWACLLCLPVFQRRRRSRLRHMWAVPTVQRGRPMRQ